MNVLQFFLDVITWGMNLVAWAMIAFTALVAFAWLVKCIDTLIEGRWDALFLALLFYFSLYWFFGR